MAGPRKANKVLFFFLLSFMNFACDGKLYHSFITLGGEWAKSDTLDFVCNVQGNVKQYDANIELRCDSYFPYHDLWLRVVALSSSGESFYCDTVKCPVYGSDGSRNGSTIGQLWQLGVSIDAIPAYSGDSLLIRVNHLMNDSVLTGIYDVGIRLSYSGRHPHAEN